MLTPIMSVACLHILLVKHGSSGGVTRDHIYVLCILRADIDTQILLMTIMLILLSVGTYTTLQEWLKNVQ